jgi:hypothetical protein
MARRQAIGAAIERLDELAAERHLSEEIVQPIRSQHLDRLKHIKNRSECGLRLVSMMERERKLVTVNERMQSDYSYELSR